jgi:hypothetical protein
VFDRSASRAAQQYRNDRPASEYDRGATQRDRWQQKTLLSVGGGKDRRFWIVSTVSEKLQSQKGMSRSAFSQVNLDGVGVPFSVRAHYHKSKAKRPMTPSWQDDCQPLLLPA